MDHQALAGLELTREVRHRSMQREHRVERCGVSQGELGTQGRVVRIADRRHGGQTVERATQDDGDETRITATGGVADAGNEGTERSGGTQGGQELATGIHSQRLMNSGDRKARLRPWAWVS